MTTLRDSALIVSQVCRSFNSNSVSFTTLPSCYGCRPNLTWPSVDLVDGDRQYSMDGGIFPRSGEPTVARHGALKHYGSTRSAIVFLNAKNDSQVS